MDKRQDAHRARHVPELLLNHVGELLLLFEHIWQEPVQRRDEFLHKCVRQRPDLAQWDHAAGLGAHHLFGNALANRPQRVRLSLQEQHHGVAKVWRHDLHLGNVRLYPLESGDEHALLLLLLPHEASKDLPGFFTRKGPARRRGLRCTCTDLLHQDRRRQGLLGVRRPEAPSAVCLHVVVPRVLVIFRLLLGLLLWEVALPVVFLILRFLHRGAFLAGL
mmetsp:Transcript_18692/g.51461  ORF Transcript_18692/g.51461 Transcript_18692/m.51461 type:complete len:219 (-) Transcript_18692:654-1310(-)